MVEILSRKERKARKARRCDICNGEIAPGESYIHSVQADNGRISDWNEHIHCEALAERYCMAMGTGDCERGDVEAWASEEVCSECDTRETCRERTPLNCPRVLQGLLPPSLLTHEDVRRYLGEKEAGNEKH